MSEALRSALEAVVAEYYAAFGRLDFAAVRALWDADEPEPLCLPEESGTFLRDWAGLEAYWAETRRTLARVQARPRDLHARSLGPDLASADWNLHWDAEVIGRAAPVGGEVRVAAIFRSRPAGWRLVQYVEAPLAPILYVRRLYEASVSTDFSDTRSVSR